MWLIDNYSTPSNITEIDGTIIDHRDIRSSIDLSDYDILFHLAAISGIKTCDANPEEAFDVNVRGTFNLLKTFKGRIIFASTSAVYGEAVHSTITEGHPALPLGTYGKTKLEAERLVKLHDNYLILRFSNIYGHGLSHKHTVADLFVDRALRKEILYVDGDGRQRRDFIHINDALHAYWNAMRSGLSGTYNIGGNEALSINDIAELVIKNYRKVFGYTLETRHLPGDVGRKWKDFIYSSRKAKEELNYEPSYSMGDEIRERLNAHSRSLCSRK